MIAYFLVESSWHDPGIGRRTLVKPTIGKLRDDWYASSLQPSITPAAADMCAPGEAQGRGFTHGHAKGHSRMGVTVSWLRSVLKDTITNCRQRVEALRSKLLSAACSVQYESANEPGAQLGVVNLPPEPFTQLQQMQSKMDGGEEEDGTKRDCVPICPPIHKSTLHGKSVPQHLAIVKY